MMPEGDNRSEGATLRSFYDLCDIPGSAVYDVDQQHFLVIPLEGTLAPSESAYTCGR